MADITARHDVKGQQGVVFHFPMGAEKIYEGAMVAANAAGFAVNAGDDANAVFVGVAEETVDNSAGAAGDKEIKVLRRGVIEVSANHTAAQTDVGLLAYAEDNQTIDLVGNTTNDVVVGRIVEFISTSKVRVDIEDRA